MIRVLMVEDSPSAALLLRGILESDPNLRVVGVVDNGEEALRFISRQKPDVVTMDIILSGSLDGYETTRRIMSSTPVPIVIISSTFTDQAIAGSFRAIQAGALAILEKPSGPANASFPIHAARITSTVRLMAGVKVVTRFPRTYAAQPADSLRPAPREAAFRNGNATAGPAAMPVQPNRDKPAGLLADDWPAVGRLVAIGASTGGPLAIQTILERIPRPFQAPVLVVQHISQPFVDGFAKWLGDTTGHPVSVARNGETILDGHVYIAPDEVHMGVDAGGRIALSSGAPEENLRPSASFLFRSVAAAHGPKAVGVILTGMGRDGSRGLQVLREAGGYCIAQDEASSAIFGMPGEAIRLGAVDRVLPLEEIPDALALLVGPRGSDKERA